jgi:hypothetical protein
MPEMTTIETALQGKPVHTSDGEKLGGVETVFFDKETHEPEWLAVRRGFLGGTRVLVPVRGATVHEDSIALRYSEAQVAGAPEVEGDEVSQETERRLASYYGLTYSERRSSTGLPEGTTRRRETPQTRGRPEEGTSGRRSTRRVGKTDEPTRDELYAEAKRLGIVGRSKMKKRELARAVERAGGRIQRRSDGRQSAKANPIEVQRYLEDIDYPTRKADLVRAAEQQRASEEVRATLQRIRDEKFDDPTDVSEAISRLR